MASKVAQGALAALLMIAPAHAEPLAAKDVERAMAQVETLMAAAGVDVAGYAATPPPAAERTTRDNPYLQGNDGGYVVGTVYVSEDALEECVPLTLVHELVHDATVKYRLFATVPNARVKDMLEALADAVTEAAAEDPYRPGCLPHRHFKVSSLDLAALASARTAQ